MLFLTTRNNLKVRIEDFGFGQRKPSFALIAWIMAASIAFVRIV